MVPNGRLAYRLNINVVGAFGEAELGKVERVRAWGDVGDRHEVLSVGGDEDGVVVNGAFVAADLPGQMVAGNGSADGDAVVDTELESSSLFVIVPGDELQRLKLLVGRVVLVQCVEGIEPGLAALLAENAAFAPGGHAHR